MTSQCASPLVDQEEAHASDFWKARNERTCSGSKPPLCKVLPQSKYCKDIDSNLGRMKLSFRCQDRVAHIRQLRVTHNTQMSERSLYNSDHELRGTHDFKFTKYSVSVGAISKPEITTQKPLTSILGARCV